MWHLFFQTVNKNLDGAKEDEIGVLSLRIAMNKQGTEGGVSDLSRSRSRVSEIQCQDVLCVYSHVLITPCTQPDLLGKNSLQLLKLHSQATCGAVCLIYKNFQSASCLLIFRYSFTVLYADKEVVRELK